MRSNPLWDQLYNDDGTVFDEIIYGFSCGKCGKQFTPGPDDDCDLEPCAERADACCAEEE